MAFGGGMHTSHINNTTQAANFFEGAMTTTTANGLAEDRGQNKEAISINEGADAASSGYGSADSPFA